MALEREGWEGPSFNIEGTRVLRTIKEGARVIRQRKRPDGTTFHTVEMPLLPKFEVLRSDGRIEKWDPYKLQDDIRATFHKIPVDEETFDRIWGEVLGELIPVAEEGKVVRADFIEDTILNVLEKVSPLVRVRYLATFCTGTPASILKRELENVVGPLPTLEGIDRGIEALSTREK